MSVPESDKKELNNIPMLQGVVSVFLVGIGQLLTKFTPDDLAELLRVIIIISPFLSFLVIQFFVRSKNKTKRVLNQKISEVQYKGNKILTHYTEEENRLRELLKGEDPNSSVSLTLQLSLSEIINKRQVIINKIADDIDQC